MLPSFTAAMGPRQARARETLIPAPAAIPGFAGLAVGFTSDDIGAKDVGFGPYFLLHHSGEWRPGTGLFDSRPLCDAAGSPVVKDRGSANPFVGGAGFPYAR